MQRIDEGRLESDLNYRFSYLCGFMQMTPDDIAAIQSVAGPLSEKVPGLVDAVYDKLFSYDCTKRHFVPRQSGYDGSVPDDLDSLQMDHEMITFRKQHLGRYLAALVTRSYDEGMVKYLDNVGKIHTPQHGSPQLNVPLVQMNALMGFVADALLATITGLGLEREDEMKCLRAFNKLLWIQNDLITRHYAAQQSGAAA